MFFKKRNQEQRQQTASANVKYWYTPGGVKYDVFSSLSLDAPHTLIAGSTGCGKSTLLHAIMHSLMATKSPADAKIMLIDPKMIELNRYARLPHCISYTETASGALAELQKASAMMMNRYQAMKQENITRWEKSEVYIIIDELADLMLSENAGAIKRELQRLLQLGRAAGIHIIACTQCPNRKIIPAELVCNFTNRIGMRTLSPIESRQVVGFKGCENLPLHGVAWYVDGCTAEMYQLPYITTADVLPLIEYWTRQAA